ncbi:Telomerase reverse transcriptase [Mycena sanguinolenta]|uniref:Telomerase reverse transcriptase n=1 Tax=Mycena sanguinolenta TaxID=230812 RepID=A0A8H6ZD88_9AGAR|nr:Telomerase reverse transcriptase [Mycena sanguinolenta]
MSDMREVVHRAIEKLLRVAVKTSRQNVITAGYSLNDRKQQSNINVALVNTNVNTNVTALLAPEWETLLHRVGTDAMLHLLTDTSLFVALPNNCLCQLVGEPIIYVHLDNLQLFNEDPSFKPPPKRRLPFSEDGVRGPPKRAKLTTAGFSSAPAPGTKIHEVPPSKVLLVRGRLFYGRAILQWHSKEIAVGLPPKHILNRLNPPQPKPKVPAPYVDPDLREQMDHARHLAKYVFARQYGLASPFKFQMSKYEAFKFPNFDDREHAIKARVVIQNSAKAERSHSVTGEVGLAAWEVHVQAAARPHLPIKGQSAPAGEHRYQRDLRTLSLVCRNPRRSHDWCQELISEHTSSAPRTQKSLATSDVSLDSDGNSILPTGLTQAALHAKTKPRFVEYSCSHIEVYRFAVLISKAVIPKAFWGSESNFKHVLRHVKTFITCRRYESLSLHHIVQGFSTSDCEWLMPPGTGARQMRVPVSDALKRRELLEDFLFWYFDSFLLPLLKTTFYVTESSALRNHVLYFRQDDWEFLCAPLIGRLTSATFEKISEAEANQVLRQRKLGYSFVRLLPKETGVRPIANLKRKGSAQNGQSINQILQAAFKILTYERDIRPHLFGASVFNTNDVYVRLKQFKARLPRDNAGNLPKLYFVKVDVQACFDTIPQQKLLEILRELISEDSYMIQRYGKVASEAGNVKRHYVQRAIPEDEHPHFLKVATDLANVLHNTIFVDQVKYSRAERDQILHLLEEHITDNIVKIGADYYRQTIGIPQGSVLSSILCSFFYGDLEKRFGKFMDDPNSVLLRQTDDYMLITTSLSQAKGFLSMMNKGHEEYGCFISMDKTLTNFDYGDQLNSIPHERGFPWCGYVIDARDLSVSVEYSRYHGNDLNDTLTVSRGRRPGAAFRHKMLQLAKARSHVIFNDSNLNSLDTVYLNIYQNFLLSAMKMNGYIRDWGLHTNKHASFLQDVVEQMISYCLAAIRNRSSTQFSTAHGGKSEVQKTAVTWLGKHAFHTVLSQKPARYSALLRVLHTFLSRPLQRRFARRFRTLVKQGLAELAPISKGYDM